MTIDKFLVINRRGNVTIRERNPHLTGNEIALRIRLTIPEALFDRPVLFAEMTIPQTAVPKASITPQITDNIERIVKEATGLNLVVSVIEHPGGSEKK